MRAVGAVAMARFDAGSFQRGPEMGGIAADDFASSVCVMPGYASAKA